MDPSSLQRLCLTTMDPEKSLSTSVHALCFHDVMVVRRFALTIRQQMIEEEDTINLTGFWEFECIVTENLLEVFVNILRQDVGNVVQGIELFIVDSNWHRVEYRIQGERRKNLELR